MLVRIRETCEPPEMQRSRVEARARRYSGQHDQVRGFEYDTYGGYDMKTVHRMYSYSLRNTKFSMVPDYKFETA